MEFAASLIGIIQLSGKVTSLAYGYIGGVSRAPRDLRALVDELGAFSRVLCSLQDVIERNPAFGEPETLRAIGSRDSPLQSCAEELQELQEKLESRRGLRGALDRLAWPLKEKETYAHIERLERFKSLFSFALNVDQLTVIRDIEKHSQRIESTLGEEIAAQITARAETEREKLLDWLHPASHDMKHLEIREGRLEGTGEWILERAEVKQWVQGEGTSRLLWGYGIPGAGKTFLCSVVTDRLLRYAATRNFGVAYVYFDYKERRSQTPTTVLACLLRQLGFGSTDMMKYVKSLQNTVVKEKRRQPTYEELYSTLERSLELHDRVFLIFDALDECDQDKQRTKLLPLLRRLADTGFSVFVTSRHHPEDIQLAFENAEKVELTPYNGDIEKFVRAKLELNARASALIERSGSKEDMIMQLVQGANGMFLLVRFQLEHLAQQTTPRRMRDALQQMIEKGDTSRQSLVDNTYRQVMERIYTQPEESVKLAIVTLSWLVRARRTLTVDELRTAVALEEGLVELDELDLPFITTVVDVCAGLVAVDTQSGNTVHLAHYSVQEYLVLNQVLPSNVDHTIALACLTYLRFLEFRTGPCSTKGELLDRLGKYPLADYAAKNLSHHLQKCKEESLVKPFLKFVSYYGASPSCLESYLQVAHFSGIREDMGLHNYTKNFHRLHFAASLGYHLTVETILDAGDEIDAANGEGCAPIHYAAEFGHLITVGILITRGALLSPRDYEGRTPLYLAARGGHASVVRILIDSGAKIEQEVNNGLNPLLVATCRGHVEVIRILLSAGAKIDFRDPKGRVALHHAAAGGSEEAVSLLIEYGADPSGKAMIKWKTTAYGGSPLHEAAEGGHINIVRILLEKGASVSARDGLGMTPLHLAAARGSVEVVELLLAHNAEPFIRDRYGATALHQAVKGGHEPVVRALIKGWGADLLINQQAFNKMTALHYAAMWGDEPLVRLLVENGAQPDVPNKFGHTPLKLAEDEGKVDVVEYLRTQ